MSFRAEEDLPLLVSGDPGQVSAAPAETSMRDVARELIEAARMAGVDPRDVIACEQWNLSYGADAIQQFKHGSFAVIADCWGAPFELYGRVMARATAIKQFCQSFGIRCRLYAPARWDAAATPGAGADIWGAVCAEGRAGATGCIVLTSREPADLPSFAGAAREYARGWPGRGSNLAPVSGSARPAVTLCAVGEGVKLRRSKGFFMHVANDQAPWSEGRAGDCIVGLLQHAPLPAPANLPPVPQKCCVIL